MQITTTEFQQNLDHYQNAALQSPVTITKNGRPHTVLISATLFEIITKGRIARPTEELDDDTLKAIAASTVSSEHAHLDTPLADCTQ